MANWTDKEITDRAAQAEGHRARIQPYIDEGIRFGMPWRKDPKKGRPDFDYVFDGTGMDGVQKFSKRLSSDLTPPFQRWFELKAGPLVAQEVQEDVNRELAGVTQIAHAAIDASGFHKAAEETYADLSLGTGALLGTEGDDHNPLIWNSVPPWALGIEEGPSGIVENVYWQRSYPAHQLMRKWPDAQWPMKVREIIAEKPMQAVDILQASYFDSAERVFRFHVLVRDEGWHTVVDRVNRVNPWNVPRWWTTSGDPWGRGPLMMALPDIKTSNKVVEMILKAAAYSLAPPLMVLHDGVINPDNLRLAPHALIRVARTGGPMGRSIEPLDLGGRVDLGQLVLQEQRANITKRMLNKELPPVTGAVRSPTEILERVKEFAFETGSSFGRLNHEFVPGVIARVLDVLDRKKVTLVDFERLKIDQLVLKVQVVSPLARAQLLEDVMNTVRFIELVRGLGGPEMLELVVPLEEALIRIAEGMGVPVWGTRTKLDRAELQRVMGKMMADMQAQAAATGAPVGPGGAPGGPGLRAVA